MPKNAFPSASLKQVEQIHVKIAQAIKNSEYAITQKEFHFYIVYNRAQLDIYSYIKKITGFGIQTDFAFGKKIYESFDDIKKINDSLGIEESFWSQMRIDIEKMLILTPISGSKLDRYYHKLYRIPEKSKKWKKPKAKRGVYVYPCLEKNAGDRIQKLNERKEKIIQCLEKSANSLKKIIIEIAILNPNQQIEQYKKVISSIEVLKTTEEVSEDSFSNMQIEDDFLTTDFLNDDMQECSGFKSKEELNGELIQNNWRLSNNEDI